MFKLSPWRRAGWVSSFALSMAWLPQSAHAETLSEIIAYVVETNPGLQAQRAALRALDESYVQARSGYGPNVSASFGNTNYEDKRGGGGGTAKAKTQSEALSIIQPLYTGGRVKSRLNAAEAQILAGRETLRRYELDLLYRTVSAYVSVRRDEMLLSINRDTVAMLQKELEDTLARDAARQITLTDVAQARARLAQAKTQLVNSKAQLGVSRAQFLGLVGQNPVSLAPPPALDDLPATVDQAFDAAEANNPQILGAKYSELSSRARLAEARANGLPSVSARYDVQHTPFLPYARKPYDNIQSASVTVSVPIYSGGQVASGIRQATEENNRDRLTIDDTRLQVIQAVSSSWQQLAGVREQLGTIAEEMKADETAYYGVRQEQKFALRSTIEVLNAELELTNAQQNLVRAQASEYVNRVQLLASIGILTSTMLSAEAQNYDSAANFRRVRDKSVPPFELPVRILDTLAAPPLGKARPATIGDDRPSAEPLPPTPGPDIPIVSILSTASGKPRTH